jgi:hypothetical protein
MMGSDLMVPLAQNASPWVIEKAETSELLQGGRYVRRRG